MFSTNKRRSGSGLRRKEVSLPVCGQLCPGQLAPKISIPRRLSVRSGIGGHCGSCSKESNREPGESRENNSEKRTDRTDRPFDGWASVLPDKQRRAAHQDFEPRGSHATENHDQARGRRAAIGQEWAGLYEDASLVTEPQSQVGELEKSKRLVDQQLLTSLQILPLQEESSAYRCSEQRGFYASLEASLSRDCENENEDKTILAGLCAGC